MKRKWLILGMLTLFIVGSFSLGALAEGKAAPEKDIVETAVDAGDFTTLTAALEKAGLVETLKGDGPFTVFAPTDAAFETLLKELDITADELLARDDLKDILLYHVVDGKIMSDSLEDGMKVKTLNGKKVKISLDPTQVNDANVIMADVKSSNGVIHVIDKVLLP
ncbi:Nex18 symbiotically induced protein [Halalkalibacillus sediminis]|uniref:Nex18 symbiotically induced protein n=1 Tax=Halalkalibacillus sediminis TaxID=2018042 RepID=A0A2I0QQW9_9BACI|nr:fasciclin domain-containing protein [Halalkalibacillus sediminis]PKR76735.1 Nex18 symbiotically induced protein [Halalkalibacillus sediminis]